jgi:hypothetical protein
MENLQKCRKSRPHSFCPDLEWMEPHHSQPSNGDVAIVLAYGPPMVALQRIDHHAVGVQLEIAELGVASNAAGDAFEMWGKMHQIG